ncbi:hypothetical protein [Luteimonas mephitis]|uniref:hypothetical protein n=1 Tax=Luteimonas mephitis TaxID=83615 RepID=UPI0012EB5B55|nr:hypothetical protein [Luteimonas mephitis]
MNNYDKAIRSVNEVKTMSAHMVALGKIRASSEDDRLNFLIAQLVGALQFRHQHNKAKSTPISLTFHELYQETHALVGYCNAQNGLKKPEWQILAERHGWSPPRVVI